VVQPSGTTMASRPREFEGRITSSSTRAAPPPLPPPPPQPSSPLPSPLPPYPRRPPPAPARFNHTTTVSGIEALRELDASRPAVVKILLEPGSSRRRAVAQVAAGLATDPATDAAGPIAPLTTGVQRYQRTRPSTRPDQPDVGRSSKCYESHHQLSCAPAWRRAGRAGPAAVMAARCARSSFDIDREAVSRWGICRST